MRESGQLWAGRYRIEREIGTGGYARVFMATHEGVGRRVALKIIDMDKVAGGGASGSRALERFEREAGLIAGLGSAHTVTLHDYGMGPEGYPFMALEYVDGPDLERVIAGEGAQRPERVERMLRGILDSLSEAHASRLLHRDVKPGNIIRTSDARGQEIYKLLDFGIAKMLDPTPARADLTREDQLIGTPRYMSPEQIMNPDEMTGASDIYSLGLVAYEMATGRPAARSMSATSLLAEQMSQESFGLKASDGVDERLARVINAMLAKDPSQRFGSADEVLAALDTGAVPAALSEEVAAAGAVAAAPAAPAAPATEVVVHVEGIGSPMFRFSIGAYMSLCGVGWLTMVKPGTAFAAAIGPPSVTVGLGATTLGLGLFCFIPMVWRWGGGDVTTGVRAVGRFVWGVVGSMAGALGLAALGIAALEMSKGDILMSGLALALGLAYTVASVALLKPVWSAGVTVSASSRLSAPSNLVLKIAREQEGRVTALEVAAQTELHYKAAEKELKRLSSEEVCEERVTRSGASFYYFEDFATADAKVDFLDDGVVFGLSDESVELDAKLREVAEHR